jgi:hypothetical protein
MNTSGPRLGRGSGHYPAYLPTNHGLAVISIRAEWNSGRLGASAHHRLGRIYKGITRPAACGRNQGSAVLP